MQFFTFVFGVVFYLIPVVTEACSCGVDWKADSFFKHAKAVFLARVVSTSLVKNNTDSISDSPVIKANVEILKYFKGRSLQIRAVSDLEYGLGNCSINLVPGQVYLLFVTDDGFIDVQNYVGMCTGSRNIKSVSQSFLRKIESLSVEK
jgi:hypothetical protein